MATLRPSVPLTRPVSVVAAVALSVLAILANFAGLALPTDGAATPPFVILSIIIIGVAGVPGVVGLWLLRRWGFILIVVMALILLTAALGIPLAPTAAIKLFSVALVLAGIAILILVTRPDARRAYH